MVRLILMVVWGLLYAPLTAAIDTPSTLLITGNIEKGSGVTPATNDTVVVFNPATEAVEEKGKVLSSRGLF